MSTLFKDTFVRKYPLAFSVFVWLMVELSYWAIEGGKYIERAQSEPLKFGLVLALKLLIFIVLSYAFAKWKKPQNNTSPQRN